MKKLVVMLLSLSFMSSFGQMKVHREASSPENYFGSKLKNIEYQLLRGDKNALFSLAPYLDSSKTLTENLGYHILQTPEKEIACRLIYENCSFLLGELNLTTRLTSAYFTKFLQVNIDKIHFDPEAAAFLITPMNKRNVKYEVRGLTAQRNAELKDEINNLMHLNWVREDGIDTLIDHKRSYALFKIAAEFYRRRERFDSYDENAKQFTDLIEALTGTEIGIEDQQHKINFHADKEFYPDARLNLMIYFAQNYQQYKWNNDLKIFNGSSITVTSPDEEIQLFQLLKSKDATLAMNAFIKLTTLNPKRVSEIADEYHRVGEAKNDTLPTFPFRFLKQLPVFTAYCRQNGFDFIGSAKIRLSVDTLRQDLSFVVRRKIEDDLIRKITINDVNALEYWSLIFEGNDFNLTYSTGRILDIFYSRHWKEILSDKRQLDWYLKKSALFSNLGIIGTCNRYLEKFRNISGPALMLLERNVSKDTDITIQNTKAIGITKKAPAKFENIKRTNDANFFDSIIDIERNFENIIKTTADSEKRDYKIQELLSKINYKQIGLALKLVKNYKFENHWAKYDFIESDFGFSIDDFEQLEVRKHFLAYYNTHTEQQVYQDYLIRANIDYRNRDRSLDYDKIYELLKYDVVGAFVGGGGGTRDNEVYALIKLLEIKFKTTLGFPPKVCNSAGVYACDSSDRVKLWMIFLQKRKLLKLSHDSPVSFSFEEN